MKKSWLTLAAAGLMAATLSMTAWAGNWNQDQTGWWYQNDDGSYLSNGWNWVDGRCYFFTPEGYCLMNTVTPDGYTVDATGAWVVDGVIQTPAGGGASDAGQIQGAESVNGLAFTVPAGYIKSTEESDATGAYFYNAARDGAIAVLSEDIPDAEEYGTLLESFSETILDMAMNEVGTPTAKAAKQFPSGVWYCYQYDAAQQFGIPGTLYAYARISGTKVQMVMLAGNIGALPDDIMTNCLR